MGSDSVGRLCGEQLGGGFARLFVSLPYLCAHLPCHSSVMFPWECLEDGRSPPRTKTEFAHLGSSEGIDYGQGFDGESCSDLCLGGEQVFKTCLDFKPEQLGLSTIIAKPDISGPRNSYRVFNLCQGR